jgi:hypothetical protein
MPKFINPGDLPPDPDITYFFPRAWVDVAISEANLRDMLHEILFDLDKPNLKAVVVEVVKHAITRGAIDRADIL